MSTNFYDTDELTFSNWFYYIKTSIRMHTHHLLQMELKTLNDVNLNPKKKKGNWSTIQKCIISNE